MVTVNMATKRPREITDEETKRKESEVNKYHKEVDISDILKEVPDENDLLNLLADINNEWYVIGLGLKVGYSILDGLEKNKNNDTYKLSKVIHAWITSTEKHFCTWETVITAIKGRLVNNKRKADEILDYLAGKVEKPRDNKTEMDRKLEIFDISDQEISQAEYNYGKIMWDNDGVTLYSPTVKECEKVMDDLAKWQPTGKTWLIRLNASNPASTRVIIRNLHKCVVTELIIKLATPFCVSALSEILPTNNTLKILNLSLYPNTRNIIIPDAIKEMIRSPSTNTSLSLYRNTPNVIIPNVIIPDVNPDAIKEMIRSLSTNTSLEVLVFSSLDITEEESVCLSELLAVNKTLRVLKFSHSNITDKHFKYICEGVTKNRTLNTLEISQNLEITSESTDTIVTLLKTSISLAELILLNNSLTNADVVLVVNALINNMKTKLYISRIHEESCKELDCYVIIKDKVVFV